jgi:short chain dehydrogenase
MPTHELSGTTALVTGASRGFGRAVAIALSSRGAHVAGVARDPGRLEELQPQLGRLRAARVQLDPRGAAAPPGTGQRGHRLLQCSRGQRLAGFRRLRRSQGHHPVHRVLCRRGVRPERAGIRFTSVLPQLTPETGLGAAGVAAYAARQGAGIPAFLDRLGPALTPEQVGTAIADIATGAADDRDAYLLTATGLSPVK